MVTPFRLGVTTDGLSHNKYRSRCYGRGACFRRVGGCDIHAAFDSPTGLIYPAWDTGQLAVRTNATVHQVLMDPDTGKARGVAFIDTATRKSYEAKARVVVLAASTLESTRILLLSKSRQHPNGLANYSGHLGHNLCEHVLGPRVHGIYKDRVGKARSNDDGRPGGFYIPRFRNLDDKSKGKDFIRGYGLEGSSGQEMFPEDAMKLTGYGQAYKKKVRDHAGAFIYMYGLGEVLPRYENRVELDPSMKDTFGHSGAALPLQVRRQRKEDVRRHDGQHAGSLRGVGLRDHPGRSRPAHRRLVGARGRHRPHGQRSQDLGAELVPAGARRQEPVRRGRRGLRLRGLPEPDLDHHGAVLAELRLSGRRAEAGPPVMPGRNA